MESRYEGDAFVYNGELFVRSITTVKAELHTQSSAGKAQWWGRLGGPLGWAVRYDIDQERDIRLATGDDLVIVMPDETAALATIAGFEAPDETELSQRALIEGHGPPPFSGSSPPSGDPPSGVREPRRPKPSPGMLAADIRAEGSR